jgi:xanthine/CO dehydrogenase XdhC/CoxF family maturation factor
VTLEELIATFRRDTDDLEPDYLSIDDDIKAWLNEAEREAALRARLIHDTSTAAVCTIAVTAPARVFRLHVAITEITRATFTPAGSTCVQVLDLTDAVELDRRYCDWRTRVELPREAIQLDTTLRLGSIPDTDGTITLETYRFPLKNIEDSSTEAPEIGAANHAYLLEWAKYRCYSRPDAEIHDPKRAETALALFTSIFGLRPDADLRKASQANRPQHNQAVW